MCQYTETVADCINSTTPPLFTTTSHTIHKINQSSTSPSPSLGFIRLAVAPTPEVKQVLVDHWRAYPTGGDVVLDYQQGGSMITYQWRRKVGVLRVLCGVGIWVWWSVGRRRRFSPSIRPIVCTRAISSTQLNPYTRTTKITQMMRWGGQGEGKLLMLALPHHAEILQDATTVEEGGWVSSG